MAPISQPSKFIRTPLEIFNNVWKSLEHVQYCQFYFSRIWYSGTCQIKNHTHLTYMYKKLEVKYNLLCNHLNPDTWIYDTCTTYSTQHSARKQTCDYHRTDINLIRVI